MCVCVCVCVCVCAACIQFSQTLLTEWSLTHLNWCTVYSFIKMRKRQYINMKTPPNRMRWLTQVPSIVTMCPRASNREVGGGSPGENGHCHQQWLEGGRGKRLALEPGGLHRPHSTEDLGLFGHSTLTGSTVGGV